MTTAEPSLFNAGTIQVLISGAVSVAICIFSVYIGGRREVQALNSLAVHKELLNKLYAPLHVLIVRKENFKSHLDSVFADTPELFSPDLESYYLTDQIDKLISLAESDYNWLRKRVGLPYSQKVVYSVKQNSFNALSNRLRFIFTEYIRIGLLVSGVTLMMFYMEGKKIEWWEAVLYSCSTGVASAAIGYLFNLVTSIYRSIRKKSQ